MDDNRRKHVSNMKKVLLFIVISIFAFCHSSSFGYWSRISGNPGASFRTALEIHGPRSLNELTLGSVESATLSPYSTGLVIDNEENLYYATFRQVYSFTSSGTLRWMFNHTTYSGTGTSFKAPTLGFNSTLYILQDYNKDSYLYVINTHNGKLMWQRKFSNGVGDIAADSEGNIYVAGKNLYSFNWYGQQNWQQNFTVDAIAIALFDTVDEFLITTYRYSQNITAITRSGQLLWQKCIFCTVPIPLGFSFHDFIQFLRLSTSSSMIIIGSTLTFTKLVNQKTFYTPYYTYLFAFDLTGELTWQLPLQQSPNTTATYWILTPNYPAIGTDGNIYFAYLYSPDDDSVLSTLVAVNASTQQLMYRNNYSQWLPNEVIVDYNNAVFVMSGPFLTAYSSTGSLLWQTVFSYNFYLYYVAISKYGNLFLVWSEQTTADYHYRANLQIIRSCPSQMIPSQNGICSNCPVGEYQSSIFNNYCQFPCNQNFYQPNPQENTACYLCTYPKTNIGKGNRNCPFYCFCLPFTLVVIILSTLCSLYLICIISGEYRLKVFLFLLSPTADVFSDIAYILTNKFYNMLLLILTIGVFFITALHFTWKLLCLRPRIYWFGLFNLWEPPFSFYPPFDFYSFEMDWSMCQYVGEFFPAFTYDEPNLEGYLLEALRVGVIIFFRIIKLLFLSLAFLIKLFGQCLLWSISLLAACFWISTWLFLSSMFYVTVGCWIIPFLFLWYFFGIFLHLTKTLTIGNVWNLWFRVFTLSNEMDTDVVVGTAELNEGLFYEFLLESMPQFALQVTNNTLLNEWSAISIFSIAVSIYITISGFFRFWHYRYRQKIPFQDIPVEIPVIPWNLTEVPPASKNHDYSLLGNSDGV
jgi:hypothetical protein